MKARFASILVFGMVLGLPFACRAETPLPPRSISVIIAGTLFDLELALTPRQRERGLMFRSRLDPERGMLFVFPDEKEREFWMKNTLIDLDIVYLDSEGRVVSAMSMSAEPPRRPDEAEEHYEERLPLYPSGKPARFALEFRAGTLSLLDLRPGQVVPIDAKALPRWAR